MGFGVILAIFLPNIYTLRYSFKITVDSFESGDFETAMSMASGFYDKDYVLQKDFASGGGIVLFMTGSVIDGEIDGKVVENSKMHKAYSGFVYGVWDTYDIKGNVLNKSKMIITDAEGELHEIEIIDYDSDGDDRNDSIFTFEEGGFFYIDIGEEITNTIAKIELIDKNGDLFASVDVLAENGAILDYSNKFYEDVEAVINEYNEDFNSDNLRELRNEFLNKDETYRLAGMSVAKEADKKATIVVVVYFIAIYVIADFIFPPHFIIKFVKWLLVKVFKVKFKEKGPKHSEIFGHDYYCKLTFAIDTESVRDFGESVQVRFQNAEGEEFTYILIKSRNYTDTQSIKAGNYVNLWVDLNEKYKTQNLPDTIEVEGYQKTITFKILNRED